MSTEDVELGQDLLLALRVKQLLSAFTPVGDRDRALHAKAKARADEALRQALLAYVGEEERCSPG